MNRINIEYMFSIGFRCTSTEALNIFKLREFSGAFDYLFIDIESAFELINKKFNNFLDDIILFNKVNNYDNQILNTLQNKNVSYMAHDYNNINLRINQNYLDINNSGNLYDWNRICIFHHHDIFNDDIRSIFINRIHRFNKIIENYSYKTCLFHITRILHNQDDSIKQYMNKIINLKYQYSIHSYIIIIVCCDNLTDDYYFSNNILFIIKNVPPYNIQINENHGTDNDLSYDYEFSIIKKYFNFNLIKKDSLSISKFPSESF